jgi:CDP-glucose 4,6-dehydratase
MNNSFWKNKKVLITGHTGFKGSWLTAMLYSLGSEVYGVSLEPTSMPSIYTLAKINELTAFSEVLDIREYSKLSKLITEFQPEIIFHLAAQSIVGVSYNNPVETYSTNIMGTINLLESVKKINSVRSIVNVTSDKCYNNKETNIGYIEDDKMGGNDPYSSSKGCVELVSEAYRKSYLNSKNICLATVRAGNVIGGGDYNKYRLIPDIFNSIDTKKKLKIRGLNSTRPWQHVIDPLLGYMMVAEHGYDSIKYSAGWNFGPSQNTSMSVHEILDFFKLYFPSLTWVEDTKVLFEETKLLHLNVEKARDQIKWEPKIAINKALDLTIKWYQESKRNKDMKAFTLDQIYTYTKMYY